MTAPEDENPSTTVQITEDEAAVYDRQIRLWGLEAQQRMRNATILVVRLRGVATEVIKNIVLAGIGKLVILDDEDVSEEDLGAGFFFRDEDVGKKRADVAKTRVESLNPQVIIQIISTSPLSNQEGLDAVVRTVDLVCLTDFSRDTQVRVNESCRRLGKPFYSGGCYGLLGYIFCDLLKHHYVAPDRTAPQDAPKSIKLTVEYPPLQTALQHKWTGLSKRQTKELNPAIVFTILAIWEFESRHSALPDGIDHTSELESIANTLSGTAHVNKQVLAAVPHDLIETMSTTARHEFSPVCAVVGGVLAQDILKVLAAREPPIANFFTFDGSTGGGTVCRLNMP